MIFDSFCPVLRQAFRA